MHLKDKTAVITGAGSGIGRAVSIALARRGCNVAVSDIDPEGLEHTSSLLRAYNVAVNCRVLDVSDSSAVQAYVDAVVSHLPEINILVNNAGVSLGGRFKEVSVVDFEWLFKINFLGVVYMTRAFLPYLMRANEGCITNMCSLFGLAAPPGQVAYSASKFAVRGFSHTLRKELNLENTCRIRVSLVYPGGVATNMADNSRPPAHASAEENERRRAMARAHMTIPTEVAGETIARGIENDKTNIYIGAYARRYAFFERFSRFF